MRLFNKMSIRSKAAAILLSVTLLSLLINTGVAFWNVFAVRSLAVETNTQLGHESSESSRQALEEAVLRAVSLLVDEKAAHVDTKLSTLETGGNLAARYIADIYAYPDSFSSVLPEKTTDKSNAGKLTLQYSLAPDTTFDDIRAELSAVGGVSYVFSSLMADAKNILSVYYGTQSGGLISYDVYSGYADDLNFEHRTRPWYLDAKEAGHLIWTDIYSDIRARGLVITCAMPVYDAAGQFMGVFAFDILLSDLDREIVSSDIGKNGYAFMIDSDGNLLSSPSYEEKNLLDSPDAEYVAHVKKMIAQEHGVATLTLDGDEIYMAYAPLPRTGWSIGMVLSREGVLEPVTAFSGRMDELSALNLSRMNESIRKSAFISAGLFIIVAALASLASVRFSNTLTSPIQELVRGVKSISGGNLVYDVKIDTGDEIETLSTAFYQMTCELSQYIDNLAAVTAEKERIGAELHVAAEIQASMLPGVFPAFPERPEFDIFATMLPAKEVGGDFYDFFLIDEDHLALVIADVSGKGVPAALFMVNARTLIKNNAQSGKCLKDVFETTNNLLCENNDAGMFVTAFMAVLEISTGRLAYINAGHCLPLLRRAHGDFEQLPAAPGFILAGIENMSFNQDETTLAHGDMFFLYTDGVTEAVNNEYELFSEERLLAAANRYKDCPLDELLVSVKREIDAFSDGAEQFDDITMLALRISPKE